MWSLGYTVRREALDNDYSAGIENIAVDSQAGIGSPMFLRTVKLKDFPWNGWLAMGVDGGARAAWNPVAGFTDPAGRLVWAAVGDPALLLDPDNGALHPQSRASAGDRGRPATFRPTRSCPRAARSSPRAPASPRARSSSTASCCRTRTTSRR